ncbi:2-amino-4-hydroxy-6-hydroxymethyldihydropteridinediphosphokinase [Aliiroseovarius sediminilitoris]|uniref:2-amino-4-hydroxy-6-hydroxymethyldihydropteridine pyrophosphokinase n=1 Tax=Aliiroseovarius sediminilitoris TaxID=1173584 RepID=A0A1I0N2Y0_9RHOB|nr:2-amino-4-hydroxy-6-hydroxymethyldihydropteridine diphosphokinase [Aliiroseovarius sediminilitoris]SEV95386.1 2-amino-4-hydroxy-6-hydroxymethyldihydropteridinediphosphokinase [Aliiroseovarius sediminilitoris]
MPQAINSRITCPKVLVSLGSNATSRRRESAKILRDAVEHLAAQGFRITRVSRYYSTPCFPAGAGPDFVNAALGIDTDLPPDEILSALHQVEAGFGRERPSRWAPRTLDLDLIACGGIILPSKSVLAHWMNLPLDDQKTRAPDQLILPHPRMHERAFVLIPLADVAPDWHHPITGKTVQQMADELPDEEKKGVLPYSHP